MRNLRTVLGAALLIILTTTAAQAQDCGSGVHATAQPTVFPNRPASAIAWTGSVLGVARNENSLQRPIYVALFNEQLVQVAPDRLAASSSLSATMELIWTGTEFGLFYQRQDLQFVLQRISAAGEPIGNAIPISPRVNFPRQEYDVVWDATRNAYAIIHTVPTGIDRGLWLTLVRADGTHVFDQPIAFFFADPATPRLAVAANGTIGVVIASSSTPEALQFISVDANNNPRTAIPISAAGRDPRIATNGTGFAVVVVAPAGAGQTELRWIRLDNNGRVTIPEATLFGGRGVDIEAVDLQWNADSNEWALAYLDSILGFNVFPGDYRLHRFTSTGAVLSDTLFSPDPTKNIYASRHPFVWTGRSYLSTIERFLGEAGSDAYFVKHCPLLARANANTRNARPGEEITFSASASGGSPDYTFVWDFGDLSRTETATTIRHHYTRPGTYTVTLGVTDIAGGRSFTTLVVKVADPRRRPAGK